MSDIDTETKITTIFRYLDDIIHVYVYPIIFFIIYNNISNYYFNKFLRNIVLIVSLHILFLSFSKKYLLTEDSKIELRLYNSVIYITFVELISYVCHRLLHNEYLNIHSHYNTTTYKYLLLNKFDILANIIYIYFPIYFIPITYSDFIIIYYHYVFIGFLSNNIVFFKIHNATKKYNYSLGIPMFDIIFGTYLSEKKYLLLSVSNND